ncbi:MAG TPA: hypothetical protein VF070_14100 [Streptosporangiaceae bacterium]
MGSLMHAVPRLGGLFCVAGVITAGRIGIFLAFGLLTVIVALIAVLSLTGTFGRPGTRTAAQTVLAILLGRNQPHRQSVLERPSGLRNVRASSQPDPRP